MHETGLAPYACDPALSRGRRYFEAPAPTRTEYQRDRDRISDPSGVLHAAANILETVAKDIINSDSSENKTLGGFVQRYEKESNLPDEIKTVVGKIYNLRNVMPLSGHGSTGVPSINMHDAIVIAAATKIIVEIEYRAKKI